jgi:hypothetical protein
MSFDFKKKKVDPGQSCIPDLNIRKDLHLSILKPSHMELKIICMRRNLTIQELFEEFVSRTITGSPDMIEILNDLEIRKRAKQVHRVTNIDAEALYEIIQKE